MFCCWQTFLNIILAYDSSFLDFIIISSIIKWELNYCLHYNSKNENIALMRNLFCLIRFDFRTVARFTYSINVSKCQIFHGSLPLSLNVRQPIILYHRMRFSLANIKLLTTVRCLSARRESPLYLQCLLEWRIMLLCVLPLLCIGVQYWFFPGSLLVLITCLQ